MSHNAHLIRYFLNNFSEVYPYSYDVRHLDTVDARITSELKGEPYVNLANNVYKYWSQNTSHPDDHFVYLSKLYKVYLRHEADLEMITAKFG